MTDEDLIKIRKLVSVSEEQIRQVVQKGLADQTIVIPKTVSGVPNYAGGANQCPNSDFAWSYMAATLSGVTPTTVDPTNDEVYRVFRQIKEADIDTQLVRTAEADAWVPLWDKELGIVAVGGVDGTDQYDIAIQFWNNVLIGNHKWYIRIAVSTSDDTPLPEGSRLFAGFWVRRSGGDEEWVTGGPFVLDHKIIGLPGTRELNYKVLAKTDTGNSIESQILNITNAPDVLDEDNYIQVTYAGAAGLIEFETYREDVASGEVRQIARDRNSSKLVAYDVGQEGRLEFSGFPTADGDELKAYAEVDIDAVSIDVQKTFHNIAFRIPPNFNTVGVAEEGTFLRIGLVSPTALNRQVYLDTVWAAESYNVWQPSPYDDYPSPPSTTMTSSPPVGGGAATSTPPPTGGGSSCVWVEHDVETDVGWVKMKDVETWMTVNNGTTKRSYLKGIHEGEESQYLLLFFDSGLVIRSSMTQRYIRSFSDSSGIIATGLKVGMTLQGGDNDGPKKIKVSQIIRISEHPDDPLPVRALQVAEGSPNKFYAVGSASTGEKIYLHNLKERDPEIYGE